MTQRLLALATALALQSCEAQVTTGPYVGGASTIYATTVPADIELYPHIWYDGGYAYLVGDRWYHAGPRGWVVLRDEPEPLYRYHSTWGYGRPTRYEHGRGGAVERQPPPTPEHYHGGGPR